MSVPGCLPVISDQYAIHVLLQAKRQLQKPRRLPLQQHRLHPRSLMNGTLSHCMLRQFTNIRAIACFKGTDRAICLWVFDSTVREPAKKVQGVQCKLNQSFVTVEWALFVRSRGLDKVLCVPLCFLWPGWAAPSFRFTWSSLCRTCCIHWRMCAWLLFGWLVLSSSMAWSIPSRCAGAYCRISGYWLSTSVPCCDGNPYCLTCLVPGFFFSLSKHSSSCTWLLQVLMWLKRTELSQAHIFLQLTRKTLATWWWA